MDDPVGGNALLREIKDHEQKVEKLRRWFRDSWTAFEPWRDDAVESYEFVGNRQWDDADIKRLATRANLTINQILAPVLWLTGMQRQQRQEVKVFPFESGDVRMAELMHGLVKHVELRSRSAAVDSHVFQDKTITGMGFWKLMVDFTNGPEGELRWFRVNPLTVFPDPNFLECGWENAKYVSHGYFRDLGEMIDEFPEHEEAIRQKFGDWMNSTSHTGSRLWSDSSAEEAGDAFTSERTFWDAETQRCRVVETWYAESIRAKVLLDLQTLETTRLEDDEAKQVEAAMAQGVTQNAIVIERPIREVRVCKILDDVLLSEAPSPFDSPKFPILPALGHYFWKFPYGNVEYQKDPQREFNKRRSTLTDLTTRMAHSGMLNHASEGAKTKEITEFFNGNGAVINYKSVPPTSVDPPTLDQTLVYLERANRDEISRVVNINTELLGQGSQRTVSGRAIEARQRSGMVVQEPMLDSFELEKQNCIEFLIEVIPKFITPARARRILGSIAIRQPELPAAQLMAQMGGGEGEAELQELLSGAYSTKFDVVVKSVPYEPSLQAQRWQILLELMQSAPTLPDGTPSIPIDLMAEAARDAGLLTKDMAQRIIANVQRAMQAQGPQQTPTPQGLMQGQPSAPAGGIPLQ